jgi:hypothetical protein
MKVDRDADPADTTDTSDPEDSAPDPADETSAPTDYSDAGTLAEGSFEEGMTAAEDPITQMMTGQSPQAQSGDGAPAEGSAPEGEAGAEGEEADEAQPETGTEAEATEEEQSREERRESWMDAERFSEKTGINVDDPDEAAEAVNELKNKVLGYQGLEEVIDENPSFQQMIAEMADGKTPAEAAAALDGVQTQAPDPNENPEAYAEWLAAQKEKEKQEEQQGEQRQKMERQRQRMEQELQAVAERHEDLAYEDVARMVAQVSPLAPQVDINPEMIGRLAKARNFDQRIEQARKEGYEEGREEALQEVRGDGTPEADDGLPDLRTGGGGAENDTTQNQAGVDDDVAEIFGPQGESVGFNHDAV